VSADENTISAILKLEPW